MNTVKKTNAFGWLSYCAAVLALVGLIIYWVSSATGFMAGQHINALPIVFSIIAVILLVAAPLLADRLDKRIIGGFLFVAVVFLAVSVCVFINERVQLFADVYFIPVNHPATEDSALNFAIVGFAFYIASFIVATIAGFADKLVKKDENEETKAAATT